MTIVTNRALLSAATRRHRLRPSLSSSLLSPLGGVGSSPIMRHTDVITCNTGNRNHHFSVSSAAFTPTSSSISSLHTTCSQNISSWSSTSPCSHPTRRFASTSHRQKTSSSKKNKKGNKDAFKKQLNKTQQQQRSIIGKRPGQTSFSPPKDKTLSSTSPPTTNSTSILLSGSNKDPIIQQQRVDTKEKPARTTNARRSLVIPPSVSQTSTVTQPLSSDHDNKDHAHTQSSASTVISQDTTNDKNNEGENNPLRNLFLQQGILPPPARPIIDKHDIKPPIDNEQKKYDFLTQTTASSATTIDIPEPDPSGVSAANPEDVLDLASMYDPSIHLPDKPNFLSAANRARYEAGTPLTDELIAYIGVRGPITVAEFMRRALRDGRFGYYTGKGSRDGQGQGKKKTGEGVGGGAAVGAVSEDAVDATLEMEDDNDWDLDDDDDDVGAIHLNDGDSTSHVGGEHVIGSGGDFITAPEVSQLFGESLLVWLMTQYQTLHSPSQIQIVEIGPGKGTLICDMVRSAVDTFPDFASALTASVDGEKGQEGRKKKVAVGVHLVEVTNGMRARQKESLRNLEKEKGFKEKGYSFRFADDDVGFDNDEKEEEAEISSVSEAGDSKSSSSSSSSNEEQKPQNTIHVSWHDVLSSVPTHDAVTGKPVPTFIVCQELVDALPIHSFQKVEGDVWRERLVDVEVRDEEEAKDAKDDIRSAARRYASAEPDDASKLTSPPSSSSTSSSSPSSEERSKKMPRLRFVLPPDTTPALRTILRVDNRGKPIISDDNPNAQALNSLPVGSIVEACPEGFLLAQDIAGRIQKCRGAALIIDYGGDGSSGGDTLRGFRKHAQVHPLSRPGEVDVTADVDFGALREAVNARVELEESLKRKLQQQQQRSARSTIGFANQTKVAVKIEEPDYQSNASAEPNRQRPEAFGPISQGKFLAQMGVVQRVTKKIEDPETSDEEAEELFSAMERLMAEEEMGERYKVLAIAPKKEGVFPPPGF